MRTAAIIPALNEAPTVAAVVETVRRSPLVDEVVVVDGGSRDDTQARARAAGARLLQASDGGKGESMATGVSAVDAEVIVFLDADLTGLTAGHVDRLVRTVTTGGAGMSCALFDRGPLANLVFLHVLPILTGERALRRELFEALDAKDRRGYRVEAALNSAAAHRGWPVAAFIATGMSHRTKEQKEPTPWRGFLAKIRMLLTAYGEYIRFWARHHGSPRPRRPSPQR